MSMYAKYTKERKGNEVIEFPFGFVEYHIALPFLCIDEMFVLPECRKRGHVREMADCVTQIARDAGCSALWAQVWVPAGASTESLKMILHMGGVVQLAQENRIILTKDLGGSDGK